MKQVQRFSLIIACMALWCQAASAQHSGPATQVVTFGIHYAHSLALAGPTLVTYFSKNQEAPISSLLVNVPANRPQKITAALRTGSSGEAKLSVKLHTGSKSLSAVPTELVATKTNVMSQRFDYSFLADSKIPPPSSTSVIFTITD